MLTRVKRLFPNALFVTLNNVAMLKAIAAGILTFGANKRVNYTYVTYRDVDHIHLFHNYKPWVKVIGTGQYYVLLQALHTTGIDKRHRILVVFMPGY